MSEEDQEKLRYAIARIQQTMEENDELNDEVIETIREVNALLESIEIKPPLMVGSESGLAGAIEIR